MDVRDASERPRKSVVRKMTAWPLSFFSLLLPLLGVVGSLAGGAAGIAKAVNDSKAAQRQLEEMQRHNRAMEGRGLYLAPYKRGHGFSTMTKKKKRQEKRNAKNACGCNN